MQLYRISTRMSKMRKLHVKRRSFLIEPANRSTETKSPRLSTKSIVLEMIGEILSLIAIFIIGWIAYVVL